MTKGKDRAPPSTSTPASLVPPDARDDVNVRPFFKRFDGYLWDSPGMEVRLPLDNYIFFGREGCGKYSMALNYIRAYSANDMRTYRTLNLTYNKRSYMLHMSDVHFEVEMNMLGSSAKALWAHIIQHIHDITILRKHKYSIVLCKNFHAITNDHMDIIQSYVKHSSDPFNKCRLYYVFLTEHISFIPQNISDVFSVVRVPLYMRRMADRRVEQKEEEKEKEEAVPDEEKEKGKGKEKEEVVPDEEKEKEKGKEESVPDEEKGKEEGKEEVVPDEEKEKEKGKEEAVPDEEKEDEEQCLCASAEGAITSVGGNRMSAVALGEAHARVCEGDYEAGRFLKYRSCIVANIEGHLYDFRPSEMIAMRNALYDIFIYHINPYDVVWRVFGRFCTRHSSRDIFEPMCFYVHEMFMQYNSNYRPMLHLEKFIVHLARHITSSSDTQIN